MGASGEGVKAEMVLVEIKELKRAVRDTVCPGMDLGHTDSL
ncbi:MAG: hypothetical protein OXH71_03010 [Candidatus Dadabacteria bacterium]|nr:hypothetical protein [Candidatus Dadabacteria bacterium]MDE0519646.1 hypothetical protein [Candidatus Dadabacteria bacterium]MDE0663395.1 hypothetical protein [Candidatus Dadabacteria bacterium]